MSKVDYSRNASKGAGSVWFADGGVASKADKWRECWSCKELLPISEFTTFASGKVNICNACMARKKESRTAAAEPFISTRHRVEARLGINLLSILGPRDDAKPAALATLDRMLAALDAGTFDKELDAEYGR